MALKPGTKLGPYEILSQLGAGGMGEVYKGRDVRLDRLVALKVLAPHLAGNQEARERFEREATTVAKLKHAYIRGLLFFERSPILAQAIHSSPSQPAADGLPPERVAARSCGSDSP